MALPRSVVPLLMWGLLLLGYSQGWTQPPPLASSPPPALDLGDLVQPNTLAARKAAVQARLASLGQQEAQKAESETTRVMLEQILKVLYALEETWQQHTAYRDQVERLPQRLQELAEERRALEAQPPPRFPALPRSYATNMRHACRRHRQTSRNSAKTRPPVRCVW
jgi:hypothetical protein